MPVVYFFILLVHIVNYLTIREYNNKEIVLNDMLQSIEENKGIFRQQDQIAVMYLNGLWRQFKDEQPHTYYAVEGINEKPHPCTPEVYVMDNKTMFMFLAWYEKDGKALNRQTGEWINLFEGDYSWCYKSDLCPDLSLYHKITERNGRGKKLVYSEYDHRKMTESIDNAIDYLKELKDIMNNK